ncbi:MAG TPA: hypothetical protein VHY91_02165 [Pirellulales bacterium]|jgi:hypothetical protein|nr:hypothetical protein [Pirellulales bacterium]
MAERESIYESTLAHIILLVVAAALIVGGAICAEPLLLYGAWTAFLLWDACFVCGDHLSDRTADSVLQQIGEARTNLSWYIVVFGGAVAYLATSRDAEQFFVELANDSRLGAPFAVLPVTAASLAVLFIPIRKSQGPPPSACTPSLKSMFGVCIFLQKVAITSFVYAAIRLMSHIVQGSQS